MFGCSYSPQKKQASEPCCKPHHEYLDVINKKHINHRLRFLLLLPEEDYRKCIYSRKDLIWARKSKFPGKLLIEKFEDVGCLLAALRLLRLTYTHASTIVYYVAKRKIIYTQ